MDKGYTQALLYDFYGEMLTDRQKSIFEQVVFEDCSYGEAAENFGISRQSVHDTLKRTNTLLESYEEKLHLVSKFLDLKKKVNEIRSLTEDERIRAIADEILEEF